MPKETSKSQRITKNVSIKLGVKTFLVVSLLTIISIKFLDTEIAIPIKYFLRTNPILLKIVVRIPDFLLHFVILGSVSMWTIYFYRLQKKKFDLQTRFLKLAATVLPVAYVVKTLLKFVFGRTCPRNLPIDNQQLTFQWFKTWSSSFPSGHMVVFAAFVTAIIIYYSQYRRLVLIFLILLGLSLIVTDSHFLSDVIAGTYIGFITTYSTRHFLEKQSIPSN